MLYMFNIYWNNILAHETVIKCVLFEDMPRSGHMGVSKIEFCLLYAKQAPYPRH